EHHTEVEELSQFVCSLIAEIFDETSTNTVRAYTLLLSHTKTWTIPSSLVDAVLTAPQAD
ncbi:unnamed protein product, partial [Amoebophrya sp. A25]